jgi:hypothetical protein
MWAALSANLRNLRNPTKRLLQTVIESDNAKAAAYAALSLAALLEVQGDNSGALRFRHALFKLLSGFRLGASPYS